MGSKLLDRVLRKARSNSAASINRAFSEQGEGCNDLSVSGAIVKNTRHLMLLVENTLADKDGVLDYEYLKVTEGLETILCDMESMLQAGHHSEKDLDKVTLILGVSSRDAARILGCTFVSNRTIKMPTVESMAFLDATKSERRKKKERNRRQRQRSWK